MNVADFSITIVFNHKGIEKRLASEIESLIFFKDFLKQNFPNLLNNLGRGKNNSIEFDNYRIGFSLDKQDITIGLIDCKKINTLQENNIYILLDKILNYLNGLVSGRINDYIDLRLNFVYQRTEDNVNDILNGMLNMGNNKFSDIIIALTSFIPHKTQLVFYKKKIAYILF